MYIIINSVDTSISVITCVESHLNVQHVKHLFTVILMAYTALPWYFFG